MATMEINFQWPETKSGATYKGKSTKNKGRSAAGGKKLIGIRQRPSGRWVAEIKDTTKKKKIRMWLGTFETAEEAARAYDEAACLLRGSNTKTNFIIPQFSTNSPIASRIRTLLNNNNNNNNNKTPSPKSLSSTAVAAADPTIDLDGAYKPDMSNCWDFSHSCCSGDDGFSMVNEVVMKLPENTAVTFSEDNLEADLLDFERMKVERQISACLYAMNGVHEYMEAVHEAASQSIWDIPFFSSLQQ